MIGIPASRLKPRSFPRYSMSRFFSLSALIVLLCVLTEGREVNARSFGEYPKRQEQQSAPEVITLEPGKPIDREMAGGQKANYQIALAEGQYASIVVEQRGIDVIVELTGSDGKPVFSCNEEYRNQGEEQIEIVAEAGGSYQLSVRANSKSAPVGQYRIRVVDIRPATQNDRSLEEARKLEADYNRSLLAGKYDEARRCAERALAISESVLGAENPFTATVLLDLAFYYDHKQDFATAISLCERALAINEKALGAEHLRTIRISRFLASLSYEINDVARAQRLAGQAVEISQKSLGPEHPFVAMCLHTLSYVTRDSKKSEPLLQQALAMAEKTMGADHHNVGLMLNGLGIIYTERGDYQQAEQYLLRAQAIYEKRLGPENINHVVGLYNLGRIVRERKDYEKAEAYYRKAIAIVEKAFGPENPRLALILNNLANIYRARGEYAKSLEMHLQVLRIAETSLGPYHPLTLTSLGNIAKTYAAQGNIAEAIKFQSRVDGVIERNIDMNLAIGSERGKLSYLNSITERTHRTISLNVNQAPNDETASALAALVLLQRKGRVLDAMAESFASLRRRSSPEAQALLESFNDTTAQLARLVLDGPRQLTFQAHQQKVSELDAKKEQLEAEISRRSAEFRALSQPVTLASIQASIPATAALIEFAVYRPFDPKAESNNEAYQAPRYIAYVVRQQGAVRWCDLGEARAVDEAVGALRQALRDPLKRDVRDHARALDEKVMQPVRALVGDARHLLISPDGALNLIPFEALVDEQGRYLIRRYGFTYLTSGRDLLRLQVARADKRESFIIADPLFGEPESPSSIADDAGILSTAKAREQPISTNYMSTVYFAPLSGTAHEARTIKSLFPEINTLLGAQATESALKQSSAPRILHIATHGFFLTDGAVASALSMNVSGTRAISASAKVENPLLRSGLALAGANLRKNGSDDGILTALEATGLNLWGTKLVTLSACDTGVGEIKIGEGVYGLRRAFVLAGAETLVMSLWPVSDYVTRTMMTDYYKNLKHGLGRGEALRQVQLSLLNRKGLEHPFYWASFIQSGEWANLDGKR